MKLLDSSVCVLSGVVLLCAPARAQITMRVSVSSAGVQGNAGCGEFVAISGDGRFVAFSSSASDLVLDDTNGVDDVFVRDRTSCITERVSLGQLGVQGNGFSRQPGISADGRYVLFVSSANNLVAGDTNNLYDVFVRDRQLGVTERVNVDSAGGQANSVSDLPSISADGRWVVFSTSASNLVPNDTNGGSDTFIHDRLTGLTERVSIDSAGAQANGGSGWECGVSADGRYVTFSSRASNLVPGDTNGAFDIFVRDRVAGITQRVSADSSAAQANDSSYFASISADGRFVAFFSYATNLVSADLDGFPGIFVHDRQSGATELVSVDSSGTPANGDVYQYGSAISGDGRFVTFLCVGGGLVPEDTNGRWDVFVHDRLTGITERISVNSSGGQTSYNNFSASPISLDGQQVAFTSSAPHLVTGDTNGSPDVFVRDRAPCSTDVANYCTSKLSSAGCTPVIVSSGNPSATAGGSFTIGAEQVLPNESGILFYSVHGSGGSPFQGGFLCATPPTWRTPLQTSSSAGAPPCTGLYTFDFNNRIASHIDPALVIGQRVWSQYWMRDAASPSTTGLTNGLTFVICQ